MCKGSKPVILIGMMGVGKTTIGRQLARRLGWRMVDSDHEIEQIAGYTVSEIFTKFGEGEFRRVETEVLARLLKEREVVIATGGGCVLSMETRQRIKEQALSIWLEADPETIYERVRHDTKRPLLRTDDPLNTIRTLYQARKNLYAEAQMKLSVEGKTISALADQIFEDIKEFL